jgi:hypothetical protein
MDQASAGIWPSCAWRCVLALVLDRKKTSCLAHSLFERGRVRSEEVGGVMEIYHGLHNGRSVIIIVEGGGKDRYVGCRPLLEVVVGSNGVRQRWRGGVGIGHLCGSCVGSVGSSGTLLDTLSGGE